MGREGDWEDLEIVSLMDEESDGKERIDWRWMMD